MKRGQKRQKDPLDRLPIGKWTRLAGGLPQVPLTFETFAVVRKGDHRRVRNGTSITAPFVTVGRGLVLVSQATTLPQVGSTMAVHRAVLTQPEPLIAQ